MRHLQFFLSILLVAVPCTADIIYVKAGGTGSGSTWADPYGDLQDGLSDAGSGDQIWVAQGTYYPTSDYGLGIGDRGRHFRMINGVAIYGGFPDTGTSGMADRDPNQYETILSGDIGVSGNNSDNCYHVFYHPDDTDLDSNAILDGFTITAGNTSGRHPHYSGGGMYNEDSSPTVSNCTFTGNSASFGGGMYNDWYSSPSVANCTFSDNTVGHGGGIFNTRYSRPTVTNCAFSINSSEYNGGGIFNRESSNPMINSCSFTGNSAISGGGLYNEDSSPTVTNCTFIRNLARYGSGMGNNHSNSTVTNCTFHGNSAYASGGGIHNYDSSSVVTNCIFGGNSAGLGGGMVNLNSSLILSNCTFTGNSADGEWAYGGGMYNYDSSPIMINCTFSGNSANEYGGGMFNGSSNPTVTNCILWDNTASFGGNEIYNDTSTPVISYCDIAGSGGSSSWDPNLGTDGGGNIDDDPLFVDTEYDDFRLLTDSPCIDAGDNSVVDANIPDLDGNPRIMNDVVDMGAYEFLPAIEADVHIVPRVINRRSRTKRVFAIVRLPEGINKADVSDAPFVLSAEDFGDDGIEATWQRVIGRPGRVSVFAFFDKAELMDLISGNGRVELTVTGELKSGQCIYGSDTVRIIRPTRRRARLRRR